MSKSNERIEKATNEVLEMLEKYNPTEIITKVYFQKYKTDKPLNNWSFNNQLINLANYLWMHPEEDPFDAIDKMDFRGFKQWKDVNRCVSKGERSFSCVINPITKKITDKNTDEEKFIIRGFKATPVFEKEQTEGDELENDVNDPRQEVIKEFNFLKVADKLNVKVMAGVSGHGEYGSYSPRNKIINVCSPEEMTFYHELAHAVDDHLLKQKGKSLKCNQDVDQEIIAQFCSNVLAYLTGKEVERTTAYTKQYITGYLNSDDISKSILELMSRINNIIDFIITESEMNIEQPIAQGVCA